MLNWITRTRSAAEADNFLLLLDVCLVAPLTRYLCAYALAPNDLVVTPGRYRLQVPHRHRGKSSLRPWAPTAEALATADRVQALLEARLVDARIRRLEELEARFMSAARKDKRREIDSKINRMLGEVWHFTLHTYQVVTDADLRRTVSIVNRIIDDRYSVPGLYG